MTRTGSILAANAAECKSKQNIGHPLWGFLKETLQFPGSEKHQQKRGVAKTRLKEMQLCILPEADTSRNSGIQ